MREESTETIASRRGELTFGGIDEEEHSQCERQGAGEEQRGAHGCGVCFVKRVREKRCAHGKGMAVEEVNWRCGVKDA